MRSAPNALLACTPLVSGETLLSFFHVVRVRLEVLCFTNRGYFTEQVTPSSPAYLGFDFVLCDLGVFFTYTEHLGRRRGA